MNEQEGLPAHPSLDATSGLKGWLIWAADNLVLRWLMLAAIVFAMVILPRPSQPVAVILAFAILVRVGAARSASDVRAMALPIANSVAPAFGLFVVAAAATAFTAFMPAMHLGLVANVLAAQLAVIVFYALGRLAGPVPLRTVCWWVFLTLAVITLLLVLEDERFIARRAIGLHDKETYFWPSALNRAFLLSALGLSFFLVLARTLRQPLMGGLAIALLAAIVVVSQSDAARIVLLVAIVGFFFSAGVAQIVMGTAVVASLALMLVGPFIYEPLMEAWKASTLADYKRYTFLARLESWSDFSALARESHYVGRGLNVSKAIATDPSLFAMPTVPCGPGVTFCPWHPHNAAVQVLIDLGILGVAWFTLVLWQVRSLVVRKISPHLQPAVATLLLGFLACCFVTEGLWPWWWWLSAGMIALWLGVLVENGGQAEAMRE